MGAFSHNAIYTHGLSKGQLKKCHVPFFRMLATDTKPRRRLGCRNGIVISISLFVICGNSSLACCGASPPLSIGNIYTSGLAHRVILRITASMSASSQGTLFAFTLVKGYQRAVTPAAYFYPVSHINLPGQAILPWNSRRSSFDSPF
jgi:hypothetical protein